MAGEGGGGAGWVAGPIFQSLFKQRHASTAEVERDLEAYRGIGMLGLTIEQAFVFSGRREGARQSRSVRRNWEEGAAQLERARYRGYFTAAELARLAGTITAMRSKGWPESAVLNSPAYALMEGSVPPAYPTDPGQVDVPYDPPYTTDPPVVGPAEPPDPDTDAAPDAQPTAGGRLDPLGIANAMLSVWQNWNAWRNRQRQTGWQINVQLPGMGGVAPAGVPTTRRGDDMAYINTSILGGEGGGWGGLAQGLLQTAGQIWGPNQAAPGGMQLTAGGGGYGYQPALGLPFGDVMPEGSAACMAGLTSPFAAGGQRGARAKTHVKCDPISGRTVWFKPAGRPLLWSGDLSACKRVRKVASRAKRARGGR